MLTILKRRIARHKPSCFCGDRSDVGAKQTRWVLTIQKWRIARRKPSCFFGDGSEVGAK